MKDCGVHARLHVVWHNVLRMPFNESFREGTRRLVYVPIEWIEELGALRQVQAERRNAVDAEDEANDLLLPGKPEFSRLLDGVGRTIVESHGGSLRYVSQRGAGATFRFTLPTWRDS
jgi:hypothetical protein